MVVNSSILLKYFIIIVVNNSNNDSISKITNNLQSDMSSNNYKIKKNYLLEKLLILL